MSFAEATSSFSPRALKWSATSGSRSSRWSCSRPARHCWLLIGVGGTIPPLIGLTAAVVVLVWKRLPYRYRRAAVTRDSMRSFLALSGSLFSMGIADLVIYALDRVILAAFRSTATVGLYEGPVRAHNLVRQLNGTLALTVLPAAARYVEQDDRARLRELLLRGTRYVSAAVVPVTITLMMLAKPILHVWLGPKFAVGAVAMTILVSYWLFASTTAVAGPMLVAVGRARALAVLAWVLAGTSLALSLALTPGLGPRGRGARDRDSLDPAGPRDPADVRPVVHRHRP